MQVGGQISNNGISNFGTIAGMMPTTEKQSILDLPLKRWFPATLETLLVVLLLLAAIVSRFYDLGRAP